ncbi:lytic murein transglycosylase [Alkalilacustris brevis]|uniref:lytic murein transglycosylase n=1 Tax=Alkalilacustris brevis TaxID=2026338 RepID=UPI000E0DF1A4|nr:lytic murein transglycosylase [Alkalilacustris brevis]
MRNVFVALGLAAFSIPGCTGANAPDRSLMPELRPAATGQGGAQVTRSRGFEQWVQGFRTRALREGISAQTFDRAFRNVRFNDDIVARDRNQAEFVRPIWQYLDGAVSAARISNGRAKLREHAALLQRIEARYGVPKEVVVAIWGLESSYGSMRGDTPIIEALATLAHDGRRASFAENQLIAALRIIEAGDVSPETMRGSWAGAMGHTQFIPTSFLEYAVDFSGNGRRDIWSEDPTDALASAAAYLARHNWTQGLPWGLEVQLPSGFDAGQAGTRRSFGEWRALGVRAAPGTEMPAQGGGRLLFPAGVQGPALLVTSNFDTIKRYNNADAYAIAIGHLSDRLRGGGPFVASWPRNDRPLNSAEREELQRLLTARGYDTGGVDGRVGPMTVAAVRAYQGAAGMAPDGYVSMDLLERLRRR